MKNYPLTPNQKPQFACFLTVKTGSTRLPQKPLLEFRGKKSIEHVIDRMKTLKGIDEMVMCITTEPADDILEKIAVGRNVNFFRGPLGDKIATWAGAAKQFDVDYFVTVDAGDDIFCDPELIDLAVKQMKQNPCDYLKIPDGLVCGGAAPCISAAAVKRVCEIKGDKKIEDYRPLFIGTGLFNVREIIVDDPIFHNKDVRLTMDYKEDYDFFKRIFDELSIDTNTVPLRKIMEFLNQRPELAKINFFRHRDYLQN